MNCRASVRDFGATGNGSTDDTRAIQATINFVRNAGGGIVYYPGPARYLVTDSLDSTGHKINTPVFHVGDGKDVSYIVHAFQPGNTYPVIDGCGNTRGGMRDLAIDFAVPWSATACGYLAAKDASGTSVGNTQIIERCSINAGSVVGDYSVVFYNSDLSRIIDTEVFTRGGGGISMGFGLPANVSSKYVTISAVKDFTQGYIMRCESVANASPALTYSGGTSICIDESYFAIVGAGNPYIIDVASTDAQSGNSISAKGIRCENQSATRGVTCLHFTSQSTYGFIEGRLETTGADPNGYMLGTGANILIGYSFHVNGSTAKYMNIGDGGVSICDFWGGAGAGGIGNITATGLGASYGLRFFGNINRAQILNTFASIIGLEIRQGSYEYESTSKLVVSPGYTAKSGRYRYVIDENIKQTTAYVGGSGAQTIFTDTLHLAALSLWNNQIPNPHMDYEFGFNVNAFDAAGTLAINLVQGGNTVQLATFTPPATNSPFLVKIRLFTQGNPELIIQAQTTVTFGINSFSAIANPNGAGITPALGDATINVVATSANNIAQATACLSQTV